MNTTTTINSSKPTATQLLNVSGAKDVAALIAQAFLVLVSWALVAFHPLFESFMYGNARMLAKLVAGKGGKAWVKHAASLWPDEQVVGLTFALIALAVTLVVAARLLYRIFSDLPVWVEQAICIVSSVVSLSAMVWVCVSCLGPALGGSVAGEDFVQGAAFLVMLLVSVAAMVCLAKWGAKINTPVAASVFALLALVTLLLVGFLGVGMDVAYVFWALGQGMRVFVVATADGIAGLLQAILIIIALPVIIPFILLAFSSMRW